MQRLEDRSDLFVAACYWDMLHLLSLVYLWGQIKHPHRSNAHAEELPSSPIMWKLRLLKPFCTSGKPHRTEGAAHCSYWESLEKSRKLTWLSSRVQTRLLHSMQIPRISLLPAQVPCCSSFPGSPGELQAEESHTPHTQHTKGTAQQGSSSRGVNSHLSKTSDTWSCFNPTEILGGKHKHCTPQTRQGSPADNKSCD